MGVQNLWPILAPVKREEHVQNLKGKRIAVDLAIWLVESQVTGAKMMQGKVTKPHLRNLFFRVSNFLRFGVELVFVIDGTPPEMKWEEIGKRMQSRFGGGRGAWGGGRGRGRGGKTKKCGRSHFKSWLKECQELLELMGVACIQSRGEAEAMCALLNSKGVVDGCLTEDGDAFLYGAHTIYRNLNMATGMVDCYSMADIESELGLDRRRLVALSLLLGCDYLPKGVPGVGKEVAMKLMRALPLTVDVLDRFEKWSHGGNSDGISKIERDIRKKALNIEGFPNQEVITEFLQTKEKIPTHSLKWKRPLLVHLQQFNLIKMEWPVEYTQEKVVPLMTLFDLTHVTSDPSGRLQPAFIVKLRVRQGVQCVEVKWHKPDDEKENNEDSEPFYVTVEDRDLFASSYPQMVADFMSAKESKKKKGRSKQKCTDPSALQLPDQPSQSTQDLKEETPPETGKDIKNRDQLHLSEERQRSSLVHACSEVTGREDMKDLPKRHQHRRRGKSKAAESSFDVGLENQLSCMSLSDNNSKEQAQEVHEKKSRSRRNAKRGTKSGIREDGVSDESYQRTHLEIMDNSPTGVVENVEGMMDQPGNAVEESIGNQSKADEEENEPEIQEDIAEVLPLFQRLQIKSLRAVNPKGNARESRRDILQSNCFRTTLSSDSKQTGGETLSMATYEKPSSETKAVVQDYCSDDGDASSISPNPGDVGTSRTTLHQSPEATDSFRKRNQSRLTDEGKLLTSCSKVAEIEYPSKTTEESADQDSPKMGNVTSDDTRYDSSVEVIDLTDSPLCDSNKSKSALSPIDTGNECDNTPSRLTAYLPVLEAVSSQLFKEDSCTFENGNEPSIEDIREVSVHERLHSFILSKGKSLSSVMKQDISFLKLEEGLARLLEELSPKSGMRLRTSLLDDNDDSVFVREKLLEDENDVEDDVHDSLTCDEADGDKEHNCEGIFPSKSQDESESHDKPSRPLTTNLKKKMPRRRPRVMHDTLMLETSLARILESLSPCHGNTSSNRQSTIASSISPPPATSSATASTSSASTPTSAASLSHGRVFSTNIGMDLGEHLAALLRDLSPQTFASVKGTLKQTKVGSLPVESGEDGVDNVSSSPPLTRRKSIMELENSLARILESMSPM